MAAARRRRRSAKAPVTPTPTPTTRRALYLPLALTLGLLTLSLLPRVQVNLRLAWSFWGASGALLIWQTVLFLRLRGASVGRSLESVLRPQHYVQAMVQIAVFAAQLCEPAFEFRPIRSAQIRPDHDIRINPYAGTAESVLGLLSDPVGKRAGQSRSDAATRPERRTH